MTKRAEPKTAQSTDYAVVFLIGSRGRVSQYFRLWKAEQLK